MSAAALPIAARLDRFGNRRDPVVGYARGSIIDSEVAESLRQQRAYQIIRERYAKHGEESLFNLTGLIRAFPFAEGDEESMRSYIHFIARSRGELEALALQRLGGDASVHEGFLATRISAAMLAIMLVMVERGDRVVSIVPADRSHPSIKQAVTLAQGVFEEVVGVDALAAALAKGPTPSVVTITAISPSKHHLSEADIVKSIALAHAKGIRVVIDDAHMASRIAIYDESPSLALAERPEVAVWSLDKHMGGPRSGFVAGEASLVRRIKARALSLGVEAQLGQYIAGWHAVERFDPAPVKAAARLAENVFRELQGAMAGHGYIAGAGLAVGGEDFVDIVLAKAGRERTALAPIELIAYTSMVILERFGAITIPAVGMPGASCTFRLMMYPDGARFGQARFVEAWKVAVDAAVAALDDPALISATLLGAAASSQR